MSLHFHYERERREPTITTHRMKIESTIRFISLFTIQYIINSILCLLIWFIPLLIIVPCRRKLILLQKNLFHSIRESTIFYSIQNNIRNNTFMSITSTSSFLFNNIFKHLNLFVCNRELLNRGINNRRIISLSRLITAM